MKRIGNAAFDENENWSNTIVCLNDSNAVLGGLGFVDPLYYSIVIDFVHCRSQTDTSNCASHEDTKNYWSENANLFEGFSVWHPRVDL